MVRGKHPRGLPVTGIKVIDEAVRALQAFVDDTDIAQILSAIRTVCVTACVEAEQMQEEDETVFVQEFAQGGVCAGLGKQASYTVKHPAVELGRVGGKVLHFLVVAVSRDPRRR